MATAPLQYKDVGLQFVRLYYDWMNSDRNKLATFYVDESKLTFEGVELSGKTAIMEKLLSLPPSKHVIITCDCQPTPNNGVLTVTLGDLVVENNPPLKFVHVVQLFPSGNSYAVANDFFRFCIG